MKRNKTDLMGWLGLRSPREMRRVRWLGPVVSTLTAVAGSVLLVVVVVEFIAASMGDDPDATALRNAGLVLAAVLGVPFLIWRTLVAQKQADVAEQALFNDKLKAAADDLHARREIRRKKKLDDAEELGFIEDDIVRRVTAIDRLEALAQERPEEAPRIARLLCVYLRQLSKSIGPDHEEHPRADMEAAAQTIGRMKRIEGVEADAVEIDLRAANLAGFDLSELRFDGAIFRKAHMNHTNFADGQLQEADFSEAHIQKANFNSANMRAADLRDAKMQGANLILANLQNAQLGNAILERANLFKTQLQRAGLQSADLQFAILRNANLCGANLYDSNLAGAKMWFASMNRETKVASASFKGAIFKNADYTEVNFSQAQVDEIFYDGSVAFKKEISRAANREKLIEWHRFNELWRAWQKEIGFDPDDPATW